MHAKLYPAHSSVDLAVRYLVSAIHGRFTGLRGQIQLSDVPDGDTPVLQGFGASFDVASFDTGVPPRDRHITGEDFLNAAAYPQATVHLASLTQDVPPAYLMTVELTLHGVTRTVDLVTDTAGPVKDAFGIMRAGATATGRLKRSEFGVDAYHGLISDDVEFTVNVQAVPASVPDDQLPPAK